MPLRLLEVGRHRVDRPGQAPELVVGDVGGVDAGGEVTPGDRAGGGLHGREGPGHAPGEVGGDQRRDEQGDDGGAEHRAAVAAERPGVDGFGEHEDGGDVTHLLERRGAEHGVAAAAVLGVAGEQGLRVEVARLDARWQRDHRRSVPRKRPRISWTSPSAPTATTAPFDARSVVATRARMRCSWRRPATVPSAMRPAGSCWSSLSNSGPTTAARCWTSLPGGVGLTAAGEPGGHQRGEHEHTEGDRDHRHEQARSADAAADGSRGRGRPR